MDEYMMMLRGGYDEFNRMTPEETQRSLEEYRAWTQRLIDKGRFVRAEKLGSDGVRYLRTDRDRIVVDGPFAETKETIGGLIIVKAADLEDLQEIADGCPIFGHGGDIEVRRIEKIEI